MRSREWDELAALDPMWAILSHPERRGGGWDAAEFLATGRDAAASLMARAQRLELPAARGSALDFGCGVGRVTHALVDHFASVLGVDASPSMLTRARRLHPGVRFAAELPQGETFDLVYCMHVLQHLESSAAILDTLAALARALAPGGLLVAQVPVHVPLRHRLQPRPRAYRALRTAGLPADLLHRRLGLHPIRTRAVSAAAAEGRLRGAGLRIVGADLLRTPGGGVSTTLFATREDRA